MDIFQTEERTPNEFQLSSQISFLQISELGSYTKGKSIMMQFFL